MKLKIKNIVIPVAVFLVLISIIFYLSSTVSMVITFKPNTAQEVILNSINLIGGTVVSTLSSDVDIIVQIRLSRWNKLIYISKLKNNEAIDNITWDYFSELEEFQN